MWYGGGGGSMWGGCICVVVSSTVVGWMTCKEGIVCGVCMGTWAAEAVTATDNKSRVDFERQSDTKQAPSRNNDIITEKSRTSNSVPYNIIWLIVIIG